MKNEMVQQLKEYFKNTPKEVAQAEWAKIEQMEFEGPKASDYINFYSNYYKVEPRECLFEGFELPQNINPEFSGFFYVISQHERSSKGGVLI